MPDAAFGALCASASALAWAVIGLLVRSLSRTFSSLALNAVRSLLGGALILLWVVTGDGFGALFAMSGRAFWLLSISMLLAVGVGDTAFFESTRGLGLARAMTLAMTYPLVASLLAVPALGEPIGVRVVIGSLLTLAGVVVTVGARSGEPAAHGSIRLGVAAALVASIAWAVSVVMLKPSLHEVDAIRAQAVRLPLAGIVLGAMPWAWRMRTPPDGRESGLLWRLGALGVLTAVSSVTFVAGVQFAGVAVATVLSSIAPIFAIPLGFVFLGERPTARTVAGAAMAVAGIAVLQG